MVGAYKLARCQLQLSELAQKAGSKSNDTNNNNKLLLTFVAVVARECKLLQQSNTQDNNTHTDTMEHLRLGLGLTPLALRGGEQRLSVSVCVCE